MKPFAHHKPRPILIIGRYDFDDLEPRPNHTKSVFIHQVSQLNSKRVHNTYVTSVSFNGFDKKNAYIKQCDSLDFAYSLANQFKSLNDVTVRQQGLASPTVLGVIKSTPCVVTEQLAGEPADHFMLKEHSHQAIDLIAHKVGLVLSLYHRRYEEPAELDRLISELLRFSSKIGLNHSRISTMLTKADLAATRVHQDPKLANFLWHSESATIGILDPTHKPYIRFPHYDLAVLLYFPLYYRDLRWNRILKAYRSKVINSYCRYRNMKWNRENAQLTAVCALQIFKKYERECVRYGFLRKHFLKSIIAIRRAFLIRKFGLQ
jgi:hypothetical protein